MELYEIRDKIVVVWAAAWVIVHRYGHTKKFAKHVVALVIKQCENFKDLKLFLADAQYHSSKIRARLREDNLIPVIPFSGNRWQKTENPMDPEYGKRWAVERVFSRLKEVFGLESNRFFGLKKVKIHVFSCVVAYLVRYKM